MPFGGDRGGACAQRSTCVASDTRGRRVKRQPRAGVATGWVESVSSVDCRRLHGKGTSRKARGCRARRASECRWCLSPVTTMSRRRMSRLRVMGCRLNPIPARTSAASRWPRVAVTLIAGAPLSGHRRHCKKNEATTVVAVAYSPQSDELMRYVLGFYSFAA